MFKFLVAKLLLPSSLSKYPLFLVLLISVSSICNANQLLDYEVDYVVTLQPEQQRAFVEMHVGGENLLRQVRFDINPNVMSRLEANGDLTINNGRAVWVPPKNNGKLSYYAKITHQRDPGEFDAIINNDWAIFRGDDIVPAMHAKYEKGTVSKTTVEFILPEDWSVETGWPRKEGNTFRVDNPERAFDRPTGWMIAGELGTRRNKIGNTEIIVSAPKGSELRRMDALTFPAFIWPQLEKAFGKTPEKLLIVGEGDPMWRGGLSGPNSLFLHADRSLITEDGTSPLIHELVHMITRIKAVTTETGGDDWLVEGLAEFYSIELVYRAKGMPKARRDKILKRLKKRGKNVENLRVAESTGDVTARAVVLLNQLDKEIRSRSDNQYSLDNVIRELIKIRKISLRDLQSVTENLIGDEIKTLNTSLLPVI